MTQIQDDFETRKDYTDPQSSDVTVVPAGPSIMNKQQITEIDAIADDIRKVADALQEAFDWSKSPQGHERWALVHQDLIDLAVIARR